MLKNKCCILGDSISEGIGGKKLNYLSKLEDLSSNKIIFKNLAKSGTTIKYVQNILTDITSINPDICIIMYGSVDAQIRANIWKNRFNLCSIIPKRYKIGGMLEPRAFYSKKWYRFIPDRVDNIVRAIIKNYVLLTQGKVQWVSDKEFKKVYIEAIENIKQYTDNIILISTVYIDDDYFLGSSIEYERFNSIIKEIANDNCLCFIDLYNIMQNIVKKEGWDSVFTYDHFHPNDKGYDLIANLIWNKILEIMENINE